MRKYVIFDMDGVLIDSQPLHFKVDSQVLEGVGHKLLLEEIEKRAGMSNADRWPSYIREFGIKESPEELSARHAKVLMKLFRESPLQPIEGIPELLGLLRDNGIPIAVASSSSLALIGLVLEKLKIGQFFDVIVTGEDCKHGKPAPDVFLKASGELHAELSQCTVIEDSGNGVKAGKAAGMHVIAYINPTSGTQDLDAADLTISSFNEINKSLDWL